MQEKLKESLQEMQDAGIITPVEEATDWVHVTHVVYKSDGKLRICLDPRNLNKAIRREHFKLRTHEDIMSRYARAKMFSKLDATKSFWQLRLDEES